MIHSEVLTHHTHHRLEFVDLTPQILAIAERSGIGQGQVMVFSRHTTCGVLINENEPLLLSDLARTLDRLADPYERYHHDDLSVRTVNLVENEPANGHSHCQNLAVGCSLTIPIVGGAPGLGRWQRVFLVELDSARAREVIIQVWGLPAA